MGRGPSGIEGFLAHFVHYRKHDGAVTGLENLAVSLYNITA